MAQAFPRCPPLHFGLMLQLYKEFRGSFRYGELRLLRVQIQIDQMAQSINSLARCKPSKSIPRWPDKHPTLSGGVTSYFQSRPLVGFCSDWYLRANHFHSMFWLTRVLSPRLWRLKKEKEFSRCNPAHYGNGLVLQCSHRLSNFVR